MDVRLDGETRLYPIIGDPIAQVKSPALLTAMLVERGVNALVVPVHVVAADLDGWIDALKKTHNADGLVITVPHKIATLGHCDLPSERAVFAGSCNVMRRMADGRWCGDNTDGQGYLDGMAKEGFDPAGKRALLVGCGGAGSAIAYEILARGASYLAIHDADATRRDRVIARLETRFPGRVVVGSADPAGHDLVANATPVGMRESDPYPVDVTRLSPDQFVACVITRPDPSPLVAFARSIGCRTMPGTGMFNSQADLLVDSLLGTGGPA
ncbi:MAG: shikimate dehydrogenase [Notoacmeibacter sp.]|nr:shikimate dehydrogenase [Notoacmeibacter sp.]